MDWRKSVGQNVRRIRLERGFSQQKVAADSEIDLTYLSGIERGLRNPSLLVMARIADALAVDLAALVTREGS